MSEFSDKLFAAMQTDEPLYEAFVRICREGAPPDADKRYQYLRNNGYVARDESDIDVYVTRVAARHWPKFQWLYDRLFEKRPDVFQGELDLVVWGCGCGLDLLALHDRAMRQNNPQLWLVVRSVTLIDISDPALDRAAEIAEMLFPVAHGRIVKYKRDFRKIETLNTLTIPPSNLCTPRLHLASNILDLFDVDEIRGFADTAKNVVARKLPFNIYDSNAKRPSYRYYNDIWVAFSPEYGGFNRVAMRMASFRNSWGTVRTWASTDNSSPDYCAYTMFSDNTLRARKWYDQLKNGNRLLRHLSRGFNRAIDNGCEDNGQLLLLIETLDKSTIGGKSFFDSYEWADVQFEKDKYSGYCELKRLLLVPKRDIVAHPLVVKIGKFAGRQKKEEGQDKGESDAKKQLDDAVADIAKRNGISDKQEISNAATQCRLVAWYDRTFLDEENRPVDIGTRLCNNGQTNGFFTDLFIIDPKGAKPLPDLEKEMDSAQRKMIYRRRQLRRIRGGAGCGKTTVMLWHGIMAILRTHQPVLFACKTETLFAHNQRRVVATLLSRIPELEYIDRELIQFRTIDKYLCEEIKDIAECQIRRCGRCMAYLSRADKKKPIPSLRCDHFHAKAEFCPILSFSKEWPNEVPERLTEEGKKAICEYCKPKHIEGLLKWKSPLLQEAESFGAVMVDEIQSISPKYVQALFNFTVAGNPYREFYVFCDERQSLQSDALENDEETKKLRVRTPKTKGPMHFNEKWNILKKPYRLIGEISGVLSEVAASIRTLGDNKFGIAETERHLYKPSFRLGIFNVTQVAINAIDHEIIKAYEELKALYAKRITVICDNVNMVRRILHSNRNVGGSHWNSTHAEYENFPIEQRLRRDFEEREDCINLTTIELAQGWDFENVILVVTKDLVQGGSVLESTYTGITRATQSLRILDASSTQWVFNHLKHFN